MCRLVFPHTQSQHRSFSLWVSGSTPCFQGCTLTALDPKVKHPLALTGWARHGGRRRARGALFCHDHLNGWNRSVLIGWVGFMTPARPACTSEDIIGKEMDILEVNVPLTSFFVLTSTVKFTYTFSACVHAHTHTQYGNSQDSGDRG